MTRTIIYRKSPLSQSRAHNIRTRVDEIKLCDTEGGNLITAERHNNVVSPVRSIGSDPDDIIDRIRFQITSEHCDGTEDFHEWRCWSPSQPKQLIDRRRQFVL